MSCNYADGLSPYENKGILGLPERFDSVPQLERKCEQLAALVRGSSHVVLHTGAGISTAAGIPDFRGPNGVWTLEREGKKPTCNISFAEARPTRAHMMIRALVESGRVQYVVSQNIDALHMKSALSRHRISELHGNMFVDQCNVCDRQFIRSSPVETVGKRSQGEACRSRGRPCRGRLHDGVLDWEHGLPERELIAAECHSSMADLSICLGTTLQIIPSGNLPLETLKYGGKLVVCNLQPTKHDNKADLKINYYVDDILERVMKHLNLDIPEYNESEDPTIRAKDQLLEWTIDRSSVLHIEKMCKMKCKGVKKLRVLVKRKRQDSSDDKQMINEVKKETVNENTSGLSPKEESDDQKANVNVESDDHKANKNVESDDHKANVNVESDDHKANVNMESDDQKANVNMESDDQEANVKVETYMKAEKSEKETKLEECDNDILDTELNLETVRNNTSIACI